MIRKLIVAVAVLGLAGSGAVAQGVSFSGSAGMGVKYTGDMENADGDTTMKSTIDWISDFDIAISASGTTDGGLTFGASTAVEAGHASSVVTDSEVYIGGESWQVKIGDLDPASHMGRSLGDVGFDGLGVDDVAEKAVTSTHADVEVSFSLGAASLAITAGQAPGNARVKAMDEEFAYRIRFQVDPDGSGDDVPVDHEYVIKTKSYYNSFGTLIAGEVYETDGKKYYIHTDDQIYQVNGKRDGTPGTATEDNTATANVDETDAGDTLITTGDATVVTGASEMNKAIVHTTFTEKVMGMDATKQDTVWATGVSFAIGSTTLGIGIDSEKLMQASVSADLGAFSGKLFYAQQKMNEGMAKESKNTGMGVEIGVPAGANTTINAVYAQGKTDYKMASMEDKTDKGFGVGVSHGLGGGATLNAGFAKVKKVTKASVGVSMSF